MKENLLSDNANMCKKKFTLYDLFILEKTL